MLATTITDVHMLKGENSTDNVPTFVNLTDRVIFKDTLVIRTHSRNNSFVLNVSSLDGTDKLDNQFTG
jgi:hypothetical protein